MRLFLSYRRNDSQTTARAVNEFLRGVGRVKKVFLDFDEIPPGSRDFVKVIDKALNKSHAAIILIGRDWAGQKPDGSWRIAEPEDHVRREVERALASGRKVLPVLLDGAPMPDPTILPDELKSLVRVNALQLRTADFKADMLNVLNAASGTSGKGLSYWRRPPLTILGLVLRLMAGAGLAGAALLGALAWLDATAPQGVCRTLDCLLAHYVGGMSESEIGQTSGTLISQRYAGLSVIVTAAILLIGAALPLLLRAVRR